MTRIIWQKCKMVGYPILIISTVFLINYISYLNLFPIRVVQIFGGNHLSPTDIKTAVRPFLSGGFFHLRIDDIRERLLGEPWVAEVMVRRAWPDHLVIQVVEKKPIAWWGDHLLLSDKGALFSPMVYPDSLKQTLPVFRGTEGTQLLMLNSFNQMNRLLAPLHVKILQLERLPDENWQVQLENGVWLKLGHTDLWARLARFVAVFPKVIGDRFANVQSVDLRYPNGIAVQWK